MTDQDNNNFNNNVEEEENEEEYNQENEEGQEFAVAFDIQINDGSFILLVGKTDEKKLILRLVDKEDETKPFYQNEFSLKELKEKNSFFTMFNNENDAINSIIKNLNESEKEIEINRDNNILLSVEMKGGNKESKVGFPLLKVEYISDAEEEEKNKKDKESDINCNNKENINIQKQNENMADGEEQIEEEMANLEEVNDEVIEEVGYNNNYNEEHLEESNLEYSDENIEKSGKKDEQINRKLDFVNDSPKKNISKNPQKENIVHTIKEDKNENEFKNQKSKQVKSGKKNLEEIINESNEKNDLGINLSEKGIKVNIPDVKISKVIEDLKNNLDSLDGAINLIEQDDEDEEDDQEQKANDKTKNKNEDFNLLKNEILKSITTFSNHFNNELKNQKEQNENKIKEMQNELKKRDNKINDIKKMLNDKISTLEKNLSKPNEELRNSKKKKDKDKDNLIYNNNNDIEKIKNEINSKIKEIEQKMNDLKNTFNKNNKNNDNLNVNLKSFLEKVNNIESKIKQNELNYSNNNNSFNNSLNSLDNRIKVFETKFKNSEISKKIDFDKKVIVDRISILENKSKNFENKIINLEKNSKLSQPNNDKDFFEKFQNLEKLVKELKERRNKSETNINKRMEEINNNDIFSKVNNLMNLTKSYEDDFKNIENNINNNNSYLEKLQKRINILENKAIKKNSYDCRQDKGQNQSELIKKISPNKINTNEESVKKIKKQKKNQSLQKQKNKDEQKEKNTKNYRIIRSIEDYTPQSKKYTSQTFNKGKIAISHSVNKSDIKASNNADINSSEYQSLTHTRSKSKRNIENENENEKILESISRTKKYKDLNPPIPKEYENGINDSKIVEYDDIIFIEKRINEIYPKLNINFTLVYRASEDGDKSLDFHNKCDKIGPNITIVKTKNGSVFGGFTVKNWEHLKRDINIKKPNLGSASRDPKAFGFCVNLQKIYNNERPEEFAIWCNRNFGATFKNNFFQIFDNCFKKGGYCSVRNNSHFGGQENDYEISGGESKFSIEEIEVYEIEFQ